MKKIVKMSLAASMLMGIGSVGLQAADVLTNIKADGQIRARYEMVDVTNDGKKNANAFTNRLAVGVGADIAGQDWISAYVQMTNVSALTDNYNPEDTRYSNVNDPKQTRLTQAYVDLKYNKTLLRAGRQAVNLDNLRFIGTVDWRQMPQTYDAIALVDNTIPNLSLLAAYVSQVNRVGDGKLGGAEKWDTSSAVLHASYQVIPELAVTAYDYMIGAGTTANDSALRANPKAGVGFDTYGIALHGTTKLSEDTSIRYRGEYARQKDPTMKLFSYASKARNMKSSYYNLELGVDVKGFIAEAQYEVLGKDRGGSGIGFSTPLATLHAMNGWADVFATPTMFKEGLEDLNLALGYKSKEFGMFKVIYHDFSTDKGGYDIGHEVDAVYSRAVPGVNNLTGMLKYANFKKDSEATNKGVAVGAAGNDTQKFWAMLDYKFATK